MASTLFFSSRVTRIPVLKRLRHRPPPPTEAPEPSASEPPPPRYNKYSFFLFYTERICNSKCFLGQYVVYR